MSAQNVPETNAASVAAKEELVVIAVRRRFAPTVIEALKSTLTTALANAHDVDTSKEQAAYYREVVADASEAISLIRSVLG